MKKITDKEYAEYDKYKTDLTYGRILTPDGLKTICEANNFDPTEIGLHFLQVYAKFENKKPTSL